MKKIGVLVFLFMVMTGAVAFSGELPEAFEVEIKHEDGTYAGAIEVKPLGVKNTVVNCFLRLDFDNLFDSGNLIGVDIYDGEGVKLGQIPYVQALVLESPKVVSNYKAEVKIDVFQNPNYGLFVYED